MKRVRFYMKSGKEIVLEIDGDDSKLSINEFINKYFPSMSNHMNWYGGKDISILLNEVESLQILE